MAITLEPIDLTETIAILVIGILAAICALQGNFEVANGLGGGLVGYLTKSVKAAINGAPKKPPLPATTHEP